jgi:hypothetical protein
MRFRGITALIATVALAVTCSAISSADAETSQLGNQQYLPGYHSIYYHENSALNFTFPVLVANSPEGTLLCKSVDDPVCTSGVRFDYNSIFKVCTSSSDVDCISSIQATNSIGKVDVGVFERYVVDNHRNGFPSSSTYSIPEGLATPSIWKLSNTPHDSGIQYAVIAGERGRVDKQSRNRSSNLAVSIVPVALRNFQSTSDYSKFPVAYDSCIQVEQTGGRKNIGCNHELGTTCYLNTSERNTCFAQYPMPIDTIFEITLKLSNQPTGWLHGRMTDPAINISKDSRGITTLVVNAKPTQVPSIFQEGMWTGLPAEMQDFWVKCMTSDVRCGEVSTHISGPNYYSQASTPEGNANLNLEAIMNPFGSVAMQGIQVLAPTIGDKATELESVWSFRSLSTEEMQDSNNCFNSGSGVKGIVTTNSTTYVAGPPQFVDGSLNYKVASMHFNPDGTVFKGNYNLVMRSDVARCLYKFSNAPVKASIEVVSGNGALSDIATSSTSEKDGWLFLSANNFTFSSPTIIVKLSQDAPVKTAPSSPIAPLVDSQTNTTQTPNKTQITCVKGKLIKKVSGLNPKCPSGFKKK